MMHILAIPAALFGRILISLLFIVAGFGKLNGLDSTEQYIQSVGLPAGLALPTAIFEIIGGLLILVGFLVRPMALLFAGFCIATTVLFHNDLADQTQVVAGLKNLAIAGGFLCLFAYGNVAYSFDSIRAKRKHERELAKANMETVKADARADVAKAHSDNHPAKGPL